MQIDKDFTLNLTAKCNLNKKGTVKKPDASYDVFYHADDFDDCLNVETRLESSTSHKDMATVDDDDRAAVEEAFVEWFEEKVDKSEIKVVDGMTLNVSFEVTPKEIRFAVIGERPIINVTKKLSHREVTKLVGDNKSVEFISPKLYYVSEIQELELFLANDIAESLFNKSCLKALNAGGLELEEVTPHAINGVRIQFRLVCTGLGK